jgi:uncharacterized protein YigA (DUF484 family)
MSASNSAKQFPVLTDEMVADYLRSRPDFFDDREQLLADMHLQHESGAAISLVERQVSVLRDRNNEILERLHKLLDNAKANDQLIEQTRRMVLGLLDAKDFEQLILALEKSLTEDFGIDFCRLHLISDTEQQDIGPLTWLSSQQAAESIHGLLNAKKVICGVLRREEREFIFGEQSAELGSAAVVPLSTHRKLGLLAIGSRDPEHYKSGMGTMFLDYIAEVLIRVLPKAMPDA